MEDIKNKNSEETENKHNDIDESSDIQTKDINSDKDSESKDIEAIKSQLEKISQSINNESDLTESEESSSLEESLSLNDNTDVDVNMNNSDDNNDSKNDEGSSENHDDIKDVIDKIDLEDIKKIKNTKSSEEKSSSIIKAYDFEKSRKFSASNVKFLEALSNEFCKNSNLQLHHELKHENLKLKFQSSKQESISSFIENTEYNTVLLDFSMGRANNLIFKIDKICVLTFVECLLGGDGSVHNKEREVTEIDSAIVKYLCEKLLNSLSLDTPNKVEASVANIFVNTAKFKTPVSSSENLFISNIDIILNNEKVGEVAICAPTISLESKMNDLISKMSGTLEDTSLDKDELLENETKVINALCENKVAFDIVAELGKTIITIGELLSLDEDDVLVLNRKIDEPIDILVGGSLAYKAQPALVGTSRAIVIEDLAEKGDISNDGEENN